MPWVQIKLDIPPHLAEAYEDLLLELGSSAVTLEDGANQPLFEPERGSTPLWDETRITGLFDAEADMEALVSQLQHEHQQRAAAFPFPKYRVEIVEDKDWEREWMEHFQPMQFGDNLWVCPSWKRPPDPEAANLILDPGLAFGTGTHPTTALCLEWLAQRDCRDKTLIDYGCGSGILGIAALLLGAKHLTATDIDPQALSASEANAMRNGITAEKMSLCYPDKMPVMQADILIANILAGPLIELMPVMSKLLKSGGEIVLSGVLASQAEELIACYQSEFELEPLVQREEWIRLSGRKR